MRYGDQSDTHVFGVLIHQTLDIGGDSTRALCVRVTSEMKEYETNKRSAYRQEPQTLDGDRTASPCPSSKQSSESLAGA